MPQVPGLTYPTIRGQVPDKVDDAIRNVFDNIFYLRNLVQSQQTELADLRARLQQLESRVHK